MYYEHSLTIYSIFKINQYIFMVTKYVKTITVFDEKKGNRND